MVIHQHSNWKARYVSGKKQQMLLPRGLLLDVWPHDARQKHRRLSLPLWPIFLRLLSLSRVRISVGNASKDTLTCKRTKRQEFALSSYFQLDLPIYWIPFNWNGRLQPKIQGLQFFIIRQENICHIHSRMYKILNDLN